MAGWTRADFGGGGGGSRAPDKAAAPRDSKAKVGKDVKGGKGKGGAGVSGGSLARIPDDIMLKVFYEGFRSPWSLANLDLVDCFPPGWQAF